MRSAGGGSKRVLAIAIDRRARWTYDSFVTTDFPHGKQDSDSFGPLGSRVFGL